MIFVSESNIDTLVIYASVGDVDISLPLVPKERYAEVLACGNEKTRREKYLVWKLLERAVKERFNLDFANLKFTKTDNGQWICPDFYFSLSHTDGAACVAVSTSAVGVDIEKIISVKEGFYSRFLTVAERERLLTLDEKEREDFFLEAWVKKESLFKRDGGVCLSPRERDTLASDAVVTRVTVGGAEYLIGLAHNANEKIEILYTEAI